MTDSRQNRARLYRAALKTTQVQSILDDIEACGSNIAVLVKGHARADATAAGATLSGILEVLRSHTAVQIRYQTDGVLWSDTFAPAADGIQLVRCELPADSL